MNRVEQQTYATDENLPRTMRKQVRSYRPPTRPNEMEGIDLEVFLNWVAGPIFAYIIAWCLLEWAAGSFGFEAPEGFFDTRVLGMMPITYAVFRYFNPESGESASPTPGAPSHHDSAVHDLLERFGLDNEDGLQSGQDLPRSPGPYDEEVHR